MKLIKRLRERVVSKLLGYGGIGALIIGLVSELIGTDIAPGEVDAVVTAAAAIAAIYGRWRAARE